MNLPTNENNEFNDDSNKNETISELDKIKSLNLEQIKLYLNNTDLLNSIINEKSKYKLNNTNNYNNNYNNNNTNNINNINIKKKSKKSRKKGFKFTKIKKYRLKLKKAEKLLKKEQELKLENEEEEEEEEKQELKIVKEEEEDEEEEDKEEEEDLDEIDQDENDENQNSTNDKSQSEYLIQGKKVLLSKSDYKRFIHCGKWRASEFFRFKQTDVFDKCEFCGFKCKTKIEGYSMCSHCRLFAQKSLVKHHMFVCKDNNRLENEHCKFQRLNDSSIQSDKIYCRYCHFNQIVNKLPSLNRLQKNLVLFINNRVIYVNSVSKKTMLWRSRLLNNNNSNNNSANNSNNINNNNSKNNNSELRKSPSKSKIEPEKLKEINTSIHNTPNNKKQIKIEAEKVNFINEQDSIVLDESVTERRGPRIKHVSRSRPIHLLNQIDSNIPISQHPRAKKKFYTELKQINDDLEPVFISWQSFNSDLKTEFILSALPEKCKISLIKTYEFSFINNNETKNMNNKNSKSLKEDLILNDQNKNCLPLSDGQTTDENSNLSSTSRSAALSTTHTLARSKASGFKKSQKEPNNLVNEALKSFDWDDYFDKNHRISTNQNFRLSSLNQQLNLNSRDTNYTPKNMSCLSKSNLNAPSSNMDNNNLDVDSSQKNLSSKRFSCKLNSYKDKFQPYNLDILNEKLKDVFKSNDLNDLNNNNNNNNNLTTNNSTSSSNTNSIVIPYPFVIPDYLVWNNNIVNKTAEISKSGFSVISYYSYSFKSACYLCGSGSDTENALNYCSVCCEPYHTYCLKETERPRPSSTILNWTCPSCKYCEICHQQTDLQNCLKCNDSFHMDCLKKANYPRKLSKKLKIWICFKCFECKLCNSKLIYYDKKSFNKMTNFDFSACFKCYEKYQLEKGFKCCQMSLSELDSSDAAKTIEPERTFYNCKKCLLWFHFDCLDLPSQDLDILKLNPICFECNFCDPDLKKLKIEFNLIKLKIFKEFFLNFECYYDKIDLDSSKQLSEMIFSFYEFLKNEQKETEFKKNLIQILANEKYSFMKKYLLDYSDMVTEDDVKKSPIDEENKSDEISEKQEQVNTVNESVEENKINFFFDEMVKCPHEDHTYAISSNSIALALQSSNMFNQNSSIDQLNKLIEQVQDFQMNPTLQKIFNSYKEMLNNCKKETEIDKNSKLTNQTNSKSLKKNFTNNEPNLNLNNLQSLMNFSNTIANSTDFRECLACRLIGDDDVCGRLIPFDGYWIHLNCLLWSDDIYIEGIQVEQILSVFNKTKILCSYCKRNGATISCYNKTCQLAYHFNCAYESKCFISDDLGKVLTEKLDKRMKTNGYFLYCPEHSANLNLEFDPDCKNIKFRKGLIINLKDETYRRKYSFPKFSLLPPKSNPFILIGSLQIDSLGDLETISDYKDFLCPINYTCSRLYWSTNEIGKKVVYKCKIWHLDEYKKELENRKKEKEKSNLIDQNELKFYLENFYDKEENLNLDSISQLDGLNDNNLFNQQTNTNQIINKSIIRVPNINQFSVIQKIPQQQHQQQQQQQIARASLTNLNEKPKVLKLESNLKCFSNIKTAFIRSSAGLTNNSTNQLNIDTKPILNLNSSDYFFNKNLLNTASRFNDNIVSPRSDRSDSSLNLNHSSNILNPIQSSFEDLQLPNSNLKIPNSFASELKRIKEPKLKKPKVEKKPKKIKTDSLSTKCTVAALLSAFNKDTRPEFSSVSSPEVNQSQSNFNLFVPQPLTQSIVENTNSNQIENIDLNILNTKLEKQVKKVVSQKVKNKLRDYFKDDLNSSKILKSDLLFYNNESNDLLTQKANIDSNLLLKNLEAKILERKNKKLNKDSSGLKTKNKFGSGLEKKKARLNKEPIDSNSCLINAKNKPLSIVNNQYNDLDLENSNSQTYRGQLVFEITCEDGLRVVSNDINKAWKVIVEKIKKLRQDYKLKALSYKSLNGVKMYGLTSRGAIYMLEQLDSIQFCPLYKTKFIHNQNTNDKWIINLNNCARTSKEYDGNKKSFDPFYWMASEHRSLNFLNLNQRFDQKFFQAAKSLQAMDMCSSMKYRHLKDFSKNALVVKRSPIHGRGLFTLVDLNPSQMIIEYSGEIIRNELCDKREKFYESKGIGCYMFRIDELEVIDATTKGNQARFINHSCDPNCISKVLVIQGQKHIVIFAQRFIPRGEELTYDYKFPKEDVKIKCLCKSAKCRKYLN